MELWESLLPQIFASVGSGIPLSMRRLRIFAGCITVVTLERRHVEAANRRYIVTKILKQKKRHGVTSIHYISETVVLENEISWTGIGLEDPMQLQQGAYGVATI